MVIADWFIIVIKIIIIIIIIIIIMVILKIPDNRKMSWIVNVCKGEGDALECDFYKGIKLLDHVMKIMERVMEKRLRNRMVGEDIQFGFCPGNDTENAVFVVRQVQEKYLAHKKDFWMAFVDLEKAFDRVLREVLWWALRSLGVKEWIIRVIKSMYEGVITAVKIKGGKKKQFEAKVGMHQGSVLSPLLFTFVLEALSRELKRVSHLC